jgi:ATP-binding cassette subfamily B protein
VAILLLQFICNRLQYLKIQETGQNIVYTLRNELMAHVESLSMRFFDLTPVGRIVTRITNDTEAVNDLYANTIVRLFRNVVKIIGLAIIMMVMNFRMAMLSFVLVPVMAVLTAVFRKLSRKTYQIVKTRITTLNTFLSEHLSGMRVIQIFAREKEKCAEFEEKNESLYRAGVREMMVFAIFRPSIYFLSVIAMAIILGGGSALVLDGVISIGMLYTFTEYISQLFTPVQELAAAAEDLESLADRLAAYDFVLATEVGGGVVPMDAAERAAREAAGRLACLLAARADCVVQMFCGLPTVLKGELPPC